MAKKILEYFTNPCYSIYRIGNSKWEMIKMQDALMRGIYDKVTNDYNVKPSKVNKFLDGIELYLQMRKLRRLAKSFNYTGYIEKNKEICNGEAVIAGTRIKPITIFCFVMNNYERFNEDITELMNYVKKEYPALDDKKILFSLLYCFGNCKIKLITKTK